MKTHSFIATAAAGSLMLATGGCSTVNTVEPARPVAQRQVLPTKVLITDSALNDRARVLNVTSATGPGGFLKIQVEVMNTSVNRLSFSYRIEWFDENGMIINLPTATSISRSLEGKEVGVITATAPTPQAKDFRIKFIEPVTP